MVVIHCIIDPTHRNEIHSGTVVTYNDRQEILCQKCTDIALNEDEPDQRPLVHKPGERQVSRVY